MHISSPITYIQRHYCFSVFPKEKSEIERERERWREKQILEHIHSMISLIPETRVCKSGEGIELNRIETKEDEVKRRIKAGRKGALFGYGDFC